MEITRRKNIMRSKKGKATVSRTFNLPTDLIEEILCRLPIKSLLKFKSVCNYWYSLFESPTFIEKHQRLFKRNPNSFSVLQEFLVENKRSGKTHSFWSINKSESDIWVEFPFLCDPVQVLGICNGLVAFITLTNSDIYICNPTTGRFRSIPLSGLACPSGSKHFRYGFDSQHNDYSLFTFVCTYLPSGEIVTVNAKVYKMSNDKWTEVSVELGEVATGQRSYQPSNLRSSRVTVNGVFYWMDLSSNITVVEYFDTSKNLFGEITLPKDFNSYERLWDMINLKGKPAMIVSYIGAEESFDLYLLDGEEKRTWTPKHTVKFGRRIHGPLVMGCVSNGNIILKERSKRKKNFFLSYNPSSGKIIDLPFPGVGMANDLYLYVESLIAVKIST